MKKKEKKTSWLLWTILLFFVAILIGGGFACTKIFFSKVANGGLLFHYSTQNREQINTEQNNKKNEKEFLDSNETNIYVNDETMNASAETKEKTDNYATMEDVSAVVENAQPFIVAIHSEMVMSQRDIFGFRSDYVVKGAGSGIIIGQNKTELLIVTNEHVISDAREISVVFDDETERSAELKGSDVMTDLAVISVSLNDLPKDTIDKIRIASLGNSNLVQVGQMAIAIGNALGYGQSTTVGYVSATERTITVNNIERRLLQTDAAINPGNSGGALLNIRGEVIGINSVKFASYEVEGVGYAIPISDAIPIINELMNREELTEQEAGYLGVEGQTVTASYASRFGIPVGVYIYSVEEGSPAKEAGLRSGDIIVKVNGRKINTKEDLQTILDYTRAGTAIAITVSKVSGRSYKEEEYVITLGKRP